MINQEEKEKKLKEFSDSLKGKTLDELKELEQEIIKEADKIDKEVMDYTFKLPTKNYSDAAKAIHLLLEKKSVQWQFTLGMVAMYDTHAEYVLEAFRGWA